MENILKLTALCAVLLSGMSVYGHSQYKPSQLQYFVNLAVNNNYNQMKIEFEKAAKHGKANLVGNTIVTNNPTAPQGVYLLAAAVSSFNPEMIKLILQYGPSKKAIQAALIDSHQIWPAKTTRTTAQDIQTIQNLLQNALNNAQ